MSTDPQPAPQGAPLPPQGAPLPRRAPGAEAPPEAPPEALPEAPPEAPILPEAPAPPGLAVPDQPQTTPERPAPAPSPPARPLPQHRIKRTRTSGVWVAVGFFAVVLLLLLIFILQNGAEVSVSYMGAHGRLPLGVALLLSAVCGVLLVVLAGAARISQLRAVARRHRRTDARRAKAAVSEPAGPAR